MIEERNIIPPEIPASEVIIGIEISQARNLLNNQPVWIILIILPIAEVRLNSKELILWTSPAYWATDTSKTLIIHRQQNSPTIAIPYKSFM